MNSLKVTVTKEGAPAMGLPPGTTGTAWRWGDDRPYRVCWHPTEIPESAATTIKPTDFDNGYVEVA